MVTNPWTATPIVQRTNSGPYAESVHQVSPAANFKMLASDSQVTSAFASN